MIRLGTTSFSRSNSFLRSSTWYRLLGGFVVVGCLAAGTVVVILRQQFPGNPVGSCTALGGIAVWTLSFGWGHIDGPGEFYGLRASRGRMALFLAGVTALFTIAMHFSRPAIAALPVVYVLVYTALPLRAAVLTGTAISLLPTLSTLRSDGTLGSEAPLALVISLIGVIVSPVIGAAVTLAVERGEQQAALLDELTRNRAEMARLSHEAGQAAERTRLARDIHDTLAQGFTSIVALTQAVERELDTDAAAARRHIALIGDTARENLTEARTMVVTLTPPALAEGSLVDLLRQLADKLASEAGTAVTFSASDDLPPLGTAAEVVLLRAAQEAITNVRKHSDASAVRVEVTATAVRVRLSVADNGIGFSIDEVGTGFGLRGMRDRAEQIGGSMTVNSRPDTGTTVCVEVPR
ncbi:sensor histidine kinase [Nocardia sp. BMG51109]|uniref:sensor histidine kinase n=1 Tax=Nocardia sp. BMG51109 TaxID=1056816 RepID=UPI00046562FD|nr:sensor histidine kinase [Nocardia sp. BMG51109]